MIRKILLFFAIAAAANLATVIALPWIVNAIVLHKIAKLGGENVALPSPRATADARTVVRPSPDLLYTACVFDLSDGPLHITAPVQDSYVSVAGFAADTRNFFAVNDGQLGPSADGSKHFDLVISRDEGFAVPVSAQRIVAPSTRGLILFRSLISRDDDLPELLRFQAQQKCEKF